MRVLQRCFGLLMCAALVIATQHGAFAQSTTGIIVGVVTDNASGTPLPGATITVVGTNLGAISNRNGEFRIANVPAGERSLQVEYLGYKTAAAQFTMSAGTVHTADFRLEDDILELEGVDIRAIRIGQARALNQQKNADNIVNVVAADQIGRFPDPNTAEAIQRIPGVSLQRDQGEGRYVQIRGSDPRLTNVTINGEQIPSPEGEVRFVALDVIPADQLASIEVNKALTPDMDADGIGGSINLVTKEATTEKVFKASVAGGYNNIVSGASFQAAATYGQRLGDDQKLGYLVSGSYYRTNRGSDNNEFEWGEEEIGGTDQESLVLGNLEFRDYEITRDRLGLSGTLDYRLSEQSSVWFRALYNRFGDDEHRRRLRLRFDKGDFETVTTSTDATVERELKDRYEVQDIYSGQIGGTFTVGTGTIEANAFYSYAQEDEPDRRDVTFELDGVDLAYGLADPSYPSFAVTNGVDILDPNNFEFGDLVHEDNLTTDQNLTAQLDYTLPFQLGDNSASVKIGGKFRNKQKDRNNVVKIYDGFDGETLMMGQFAGEFVPENFLSQGYETFVFGQSPDPDKVRDFFDANSGNFEVDDNGSHEDSDPGNYEATENTLAGYLMGKAEFGKFSTLVGARFEQIDIEYTGNEVVFNEDGDYSETNTVTGEHSYGKLFPMVHLRYRLGENTNLRGAWTNSLSRPNYYDLTPYRLVFREDEEMEIGNPELVPTTAMNVDVMAEHYFESVGVLSGGFFYKQLNDYVYVAQSEQIVGPFTGFETTQPVNGENATLYGFELNWQQQLTFLPGALSGLGIYANYTFTDSEAEVPGRDENITLPGQAQNVGNVALSYEKYGFSGRVAVNFADAFIAEVGGGADEDIYYDSHVQLDLSLSQKLNDHFQVFAELINLTDEPLRYYQGDTDRPISQEFYSWWSHIGIRYSL